MNKFGSVPQSNGSTRRLYVKDMKGVSNKVVLSSTERDLSSEATLAEGRFLHQELRQGLVLHFSDVTEHSAFTTTSEISEGLSCIFFLNGEVDISVGDRKFNLRGNDRRRVSASAIVNARKDSFQRATLRKQRLCHVVVTASPEWLSLEGLSEFRASSSGSALLGEHLKTATWNPSSSLVRGLEEMLQLSSLHPGLRKLYLEARAIDIVRETIEAVAGLERDNASDTLLTRRQLMQLKLAKDYILANLGEGLNIDGIARETGISSSGLQKLFRFAIGRSVFEFIRDERINQAYNSLKSGEINIKEASAVAGYSNPANFTTAFKKHFGFTPKNIPN